MKNAVSLKEWTKEKSTNMLYAVILYLIDGMKLVLEKHEMKIHMSTLRETGKVWGAGDLNLFRDCAILSKLDLQYLSN